MTGGPSRLRLAAGLVALVSWGVAYAWPLGAVVRRSLEGVAGQPGLSLSTVRSVLTDPRIGRLAAWSVAQCVTSTLCVVAVGVPIGWVIARYEFRGRRLLSALLMTPFVLPTLTVAAAVLAVSGGVPTSMPARFALIVAAHVTFNVGLMARSTSAAVATVDADIEQSAMTLGRTRWQAVRTTTLPAIAPAVRSAAIVVALFCLTSFGVIVALGGASIGTIEVEVWYLTTRRLDLASAAVLVFVQLVVVLALVAWYRRTRRLVPAGATAVRPRRPRTGAETRAVMAASIIGVVVCGLPLLALVVRSFRGLGVGGSSHRAGVVAERWTLDNYRVLGSEGGRALVHSLGAGAVATIVALVLATPVVVVAARDDRIGRWFEAASLVPLALSAATMGLGFLLAFSGPTLDLRGTWIIVPLVQGATAAPVVARIVVTAVRALDRSHVEAAAVLGATPARRIRTVVWASLRRSLVVAVGFAFAMAIGEFGATVFLARSADPTMPTLIGRLLGRPGTANLGEALALSCTLGAVAAVSVLVADRVGDGGPSF